MRGRRKEKKEKGVKEVRWSEVCVMEEVGWLTVCPYTCPLHPPTGAER